MKFIFSFLLIIVLIFTNAECTRKNYYGYKVYHVEFETDEQFQILYQLRINSNSEDLSIWQLSRSQHYADIMVPPVRQESFLDYLQSKGFIYSVKIEDVEKNIQESR